MLLDTCFKHCLTYSDSCYIQIAAINEYRNYTKSCPWRIYFANGSEDVPEQVKARSAKVSFPICGKELQEEINFQRHIKCAHSKVYVVNTGQPLVIVH